MLADTDRALAPVLLEAKRWLAYGMLGAIGLHAAAALAHHHLLRDGVLASMLPGARAPAEPTPPARPARDDGAAGGTEAQGLA
jgi:cytochrome b561